MSAYIDEIRKVSVCVNGSAVDGDAVQILETMPQTNEVLEFTQLIGPFYEFVDDRGQSNGSLAAVKKKPARAHVSKKKSDLNGFGGDDEHHHPHLNNRHEQPTSLTNGLLSTPVSVSTANGRSPSSSPSSSSTSTLSSSGTPVSSLDSLACPSRRCR